MRPRTCENACVGPSPGKVSSSKSIEKLDPAKLHGVHIWAHSCPENKTLRAIHRKNALFDDACLISNYDDKRTVMQESLAAIPCMVILVLQRSCESTRLSTAAVFGCRIVQESGSTFLLKAFNCLQVVRQAFTRYCMTYLEILFVSYLLHVKFLQKNH